MHTLCATTYKTHSVTYTEGRTEEKAEK